MRRIKVLAAHERALWDALNTLADVGLPSVISIVEAEAGLSNAEFAILSRLVTHGVLFQQEVYWAGTKADYRIN